MSDPIDHWSPWLLVETGPGCDQLGLLVRKAVHLVIDEGHPEYSILILVKRQEERVLLRRMLDAVTLTHVPVDTHWGWMLWTLRRGRYIPPESVLWTDIDQRHVRAYADRKYKATGPRMAGTMRKSAKGFLRDWVPGRWLQAMKAGGHRMLLDPWFKSYLISDAQALPQQMWEGWLHIRPKRLFAVCDMSMVEGEGEENLARQHDLGMWEVDTWTDNIKHPSGIVGALNAVGKGLPVHRLKPQRNEVGRFELLKMYPGQVFENLHPAIAPDRIAVVATDERHAEAIQNVLWNDARVRLRRPPPPYEGVGPQVLRRALALCVNRENDMFSRLILARNQRIKRIRKKKVKGTVWKTPPLYLAIRAATAKHVETAFHAAQILVGMLDLGGLVGVTEFLHQIETWEKESPSNRWAVSDWLDSLVDEDPSLWKEDKQEEPYVLLPDELPYRRFDVVLVSHVVDRHWPPDRAKSGPERLAWQMKLYRSIARAEQACYLWTPEMFPTVGRGGLVAGNPSIYMTQEVVDAQTD